MLTLELFVTRDCPNCGRARRVAARAAEHFPPLRVEIIDLDAPRREIPAEVFAAPTFRLDGRIISLGTPAWATLAAQIRMRLVDRPNRRLSAPHLRHG